MVLTSAIAIGVAMDAFAVSVSNGMRTTRGRAAAAVRMSVAFGIAQCLMTWLGFVLGDALWLRSAGMAGQWIAVTILMVLGIKMIWDGRTNSQKQNKIVVLKSNWVTLVLESVAVSIDAFMIGLGLATLTDHILGAALYIGMVSLLLSMVGFALGYLIGSKLVLKPEYLGGGLLVLISLYIAVKLILTIVNTI